MLLLFHPIKKAVDERILNFIDKTIFLTDVSVRLEEVIDSLILIWFGTSNSSNCIAFLSRVGNEFDEVLRLIQFNVSEMRVIIFAHGSFGPAVVQFCDLVESCRMYTSDHSGCVILGVVLGLGIELGHAFTKKHHDRPVKVILESQAVGAMILTCRGIHLCCHVSGVS